MTDECFKYGYAAIGVGFAAVNDKDGKLMFFEKDGDSNLQIIYREYRWVASSDNEDNRYYISLEQAISSEQWRVEQ